ncbi:MAG TPA: class I SAM-dependent methyltransferase [archaeon]|nr:class I SAM-dependent methyltransferase [archaeon]
MMSLSEEWSILSESMYGHEFIDELAKLFEAEGSKFVLECGCGNGFVLHGLAERGFNCTGIDASSEMISLAVKHHNHQNITYRILNWFELSKLAGVFDVVICRGNSLTYVNSWSIERQEFNSNAALTGIEKSLQVFFDKLKTSGMLYIDTITEDEIRRMGGHVKIDVDDVHLEGSIEHDWANKARYVSGGGLVRGQDFYGASVSYLLTPNELEAMIQIHKPSRIWHPEIKHEKNYHVICARK